MAQEPKSIHPWQPAWWLPQLNNDHRQDSCRRVAEASAPKASYYVLIVLSTLIAGYGLVSNSTATVIGAMIVAPLMGPILGLALGTVLADVRMFRRSLLAESTGVVLVILTGMLVAAAVGVDHIDYAGSEIAGRTRPTLYDLAIGLAAGFAGAYCTVHPGLQASVAGVAIAVALVPPLTVTGLTGAGWLSGNTAFEPVFGSFMLFFTNLLTIELASGLVFFGTGFRYIKDRPKAVFAKTIAVKAVLLLLTGWFLSVQLSNLFQERYGLSTSRALLESMLREIPGADLDSLEVELYKDVLNVRAVVGSRSNIEPPTVAQFQRRLDAAIKEKLPKAQVQLVVRTVNSTYAAATGYLFEPGRRNLGDDEKRVQALDVLLRDLLSRFPGVELVSFAPDKVDRPDVSGKPIGLTVTLNSPYEFGPRFVKDLETQLNAQLASDSLFNGYTYRLLIKNILIRNATAGGQVSVAAPEMRSTEEQEGAKRAEKLRDLLISALEIDGIAEVTEIQVRTAEADLLPSLTPQTGPTPGATPDPSQSSEPPTDSYAATVRLRSPKLIDGTKLLDVRNTVSKIYENDTGRQLKLTLDTSSVVGTELFLDWSQSALASEEAPESVTEDVLKESMTRNLAEFVKNVAGARLHGGVEVHKVGAGEDYKVFAVVVTAKPLPNKTVVTWQKALLERTPQIKSVELEVENQIGQTIKLTPSRRK